MRLLARAPGKLNLCLFLGPVRSDGRHELVTVLESVSLADELELTTLDAGLDRVECPGVEGENLAATALAGLRARGWEAPPVQLRIDKRVPVAAGMGGGSADAAAALRLAVELAPGRPEEVAELAAELGADVPSQLAPGLTLATGAGDEIEPLAPLAPHAFVIVPLAARLATAHVYAEADRLGLPRDGEELGRRYQQLLDALEPEGQLAPELLVNDLEPAAVSLCPPIGGTLEAVRAGGAQRAIVCGSGPTVAGVFWGADALERAAELAGRFPGALPASPVHAEFGSPRFA